MSKRKIIKYAIESSIYSGSLVTTVNNLIKDGWEPLGPVQIIAATSSSSATFCQTLVLYEPEPDNSDIEQLL